MYVGNVGMSISHIYPHPRARAHTRARACALARRVHTHVQGSVRVFLGLQALRGFKTSVDL